MSVANVFITNNMKYINLNQGIYENHYLNGSINFDFCILKGEINLDRSKLPPEILAKIDDTSTIIRIKSPSEFD